MDVEDYSYHVLETLNCGDDKHWIIRVVGDYENVYYKPDHRLVLSESPKLPKGPLVVLGEVDRLAGLEVLSSKEGIVVVRITNLLTTDVPCPETYQSASVRVEFTDD